MIRVCVHCDDEFDDMSPEKRKSGGRINECPACAIESVVKYAGVQAADGKQSQVTIMKFSSERDKSAYMRFWQNNSGFHKGKSCQLGTHLSTTPSIGFETISGFSPTNHKGKA